MGGHTHHTPIPSNKKVLYEASTPQQANIGLNICGIFGQIYFVCLEVLTDLISGS